MSDHLFVCSCGDVEHQFVVRRFADESEVYLSIHLAPLSFLARLKYALLYVLGKQSKYGAFGEIVLDKEQCARLSYLVNNNEEC